MHRSGWPAGRQAGRIRGPGEVSGPRIPRRENRNLLFWSHKRIKNVKTQSFLCDQICGMNLREEIGVFVPWRCGPPALRLSERERGREGGREGEREG